LYSNNYFSEGGGNNLTLDAVEGIDPELRTVILNPDNPQGLPPVTSTNLETDTINLNFECYG